MRSVELGVLGAGLNVTLFNHNYGLGFQLDLDDLLWTAINLVESSLKSVIKTIFPFRSRSLLERGLGTETLSLEGIEPILQRRQLADPFARPDVAAVLAKAKPYRLKGLPGYTDENAPWVDLQFFPGGPEEFLRVAESSRKGGAKGRSGLGKGKGKLVLEPIKDFDRRDGYRPAGKGFR